MSLMIYFTEDGLHISGGNELQLTVKGHTGIDILTEDGKIHITRQGLMQPFGFGEMIRIPAREGGLMPFHPFSGGASMADYAVYILSRPEYELPMSLKRINELVAENTIHGGAARNTVHAALSRDPRISQPERGMYTLSDRAWAALDSEKPLADKLS